MESCVESCIRRWGNMPKRLTTRNAKGSLGSTADMAVGAGRIAADMEDREVGQLVGAAPIEEDAAAELQMRLPVLHGRVVGEEILMENFRTRTQARGQMHTPQGWGFHRTVGV